MIRSITLSAVLGAAVAAAAVYLFSQPVGQSLLAAWRGMPDPVAEMEAWPICTTMALVADEADWVQLDPDFAAGKKALAAGEWASAIAALKLAALRDPRNADIQTTSGTPIATAPFLSWCYSDPLIAVAVGSSHLSATGVRTVK
jgi:hypothetical protein